MNFPAKKTQPIVRKTDLFSALQDLMWNTQTPE